MNKFERIIESLYLSIEENKVYIDQITGCKSRYYYDTVVRKKYVGKEVLVLYVDINDLKKINDTRGHQSGTSLIKRVANQLLQLHRGAEVCRIGGDEFIVILSSSFDMNYIDSRGRFSYGYAYKEKYEDISSVVRKAEDNMYKMKKIYYSFHSDR